MRATAAAVLLFCLMACAAPAEARVERYLLVFAADAGRDGERTPPTPLLYAERSAAAVARELQRFARFSEGRTQVVTSATVSGVEAAAESLRAKMEQDRREDPTLEALLMVFYTGHGRAGRLLLNDGPFSRKRLAVLLEHLKAELQIVVLDACHADTLAGMGAGADVNPHLIIPREELTAEGRLYLLSTGGGPSFEAAELGAAVFTHYFSQGLSAAPVDGGGVTLQSVWEYARDRTARYVRERGRSQNPVKMSSRHVERSELLLSFPPVEPARVAFGPHHEGVFVVTSELDSMLYELKKDAGGRQELSVAPGAVTIFDGGTEGAVLWFGELLPGETWELPETTAGLGAPSSAALGGDGEPPTPEELAAAEAARLEADGALREFRFADALPLYRRALELSGWPEMWFFIGRALQGEKRFADALDAFRRFLASAPEGRGRVVAERRVAECLHALRRSTIRLQVAPFGARISLDGVPVGEAPMEPITVRPGEHTIRASLAGHAPIERRIRLAGAEEAPFVAALQPLPPSPGGAAGLEEREPELATGAQLAVTADAESDRTGEWAWGLLGGGVAVAAVGGGVYAWGERDHREIVDAEGYADGGTVQMAQGRARDLEASGDRKKVAGYVLWGLGGAAVITSGVLFAIDTSSDGGDVGAPTPAVTSFGATPLDGGLAVQLGGRF